MHAKRSTPQRVVLQAPKSLSPQSVWLRPGRTVFSLSCRSVYRCYTKHKLTKACRRHGENEPRSVGTQSVAHGMTVLLQVASSLPNSSAQSFTASFRRWPFGLPMTLSAPRHGDFPRSMLGRAPCVLAAWPCFPCLHCSRERRFASANSKLPMCLLASSLPKLLYNPKFGCFICIAHVCGRRHGENEPRSVGTQSGAHGMTVLLQVASSLTNSSAQSFTASFRRWPFGLPMTLSAPMHGDFPRSMLGSELPVCWLRGRASPASTAVVNGALHLQTPSSQCVCLQAHCQNYCTIQSLDALFA